MGVCISSSHLHTFSSSHLLSHLLIFTSAHLHICSSSHLLSHLLIFTSSHLHTFSSSHLLIFTSSHLHICSSSHLLIFTSSYLHIFSSSHLLILTSLSLSPLSSLLSLSPFSLPFLSLAFFIFLSLGRGWCRRVDFPMFLLLGFYSAFPWFFLHFPIVSMVYSIFGWFLVDFFHGFTRLLHNLTLPFQSPQVHLGGQTRGDWYITFKNVPTAMPTLHLIP